MPLQNSNNNSQFKSQYTYNWLETVQESRTHLEDSQGQYQVSEGSYADQVPFPLEGQWQVDLFPGRVLIIG